VLQQQRTDVRIIIRILKDQSLALRIDLLRHIDIGPITIGVSAEKVVNNRTAIGFPKSVVRHRAETVGEYLKPKIVVIVRGPAVADINVSDPTSGGLDVQVERR